MLGALSGSGPLKFYLDEGEKYVAPNFYHGKKANQFSKCYYIPDMLCGNPIICESMFAAFFACLFSVSCLTLANK